MQTSLPTALFDKALASNLRFRPPQEGDAEAWFLWRSEASCLRYNPLSPQSAPQLAKRLSLSHPNLRDPDRAEYRFFVEASGILIGTVALHQPSWGMHHAEIGYQISEAYQGQGFGLCAVGLFVDYLFQTTSLRRLIALVAAGNRPSCRIVERLGFVHEGTLREHYRIQGVFTDERYYGLLRRAWLPLPSLPFFENPSAEQDL